MDIPGIIPEKPISGNITCKIEHRGEEKRSVLIVSGTRNLFFLDYAKEEVVAEFMQYSSDGAVMKYEKDQDPTTKRQSSAFKVEIVIPQDIEDNMKLATVKHAHGLYSVHLPLKKQVEDAPKATSF